MVDMSFPAKIQFLPRLAGVKKIWEVQTEESLFLEWIPGDKKKRIDKKQMNEFIKDTNNLIFYYGEEFFGIMSEIENRKPINMEIIKKYWQQWGPLVSSSENKTTLAELMETCLFIILLKVIWHKTNENYVLPYIEKYFETVDKYTKAITEANKNPLLEKKIPIPKYWGAVFDFNEEKSRNLIEWYPMPQKPPQKKSKQISLFNLYIKHPPDKERMNYNLFPEKKLDWIRESILQVIADYIMKLRPTFFARVTGTEMHFTGQTDNLLLAYIMSEIFLVKDKQVKYCECGCGRLVPPNAKKYATPQCKYNKPIYRIKDWLSHRKQRGTLTEVKHQKLIEIAEDLFEQNHTEQQVREHLEGLLNKEG